MHLCRGDCFLGNVTQLFKCGRQEVARQLDERKQNIDQQPEAAYNEPMHDREPGEYWTKE